MKSLVRLSVKILALYFFSLGLFNSIGYISLLIFQSDKVLFMSNFQVIIVPLCYLGFGVLFWNTSDYIANKLFNKTEDIEEGVSLNLSLEMFLSTLIFIVGIIVITNAFPKIISEIYVLITLKGLGASPTQIIRDKAAITENVIKLIIGCFLIFRFKGISRMIRKLQNFGIYQTKDKG